MNNLVEELLACYSKLCRHLTRELRDPHTADDIAQHSFEKVYAKMMREGAAAIESPQALLFHTAHNIVIDFIRQRKHQQDYLEASLAAAEALPCHAPSAETIVMYRQLMEKVVVKLESLPGRRRDVYILFRVYGYSRTEIAERLAITEAAVAKHVVRATLDCATALAELRELAGPEC